MHTLLTGTHRDSRVNIVSDDKPGKFRTHVTFFATCNPSTLIIYHSDRETGYRLTLTVTNTVHTLQYVYKQKSTYTPAVPQCLSRRPNWDPPPPSPEASVPPRKQGGRDTLACGWGGGGPTSDD